MDTSRCDPQVDEEDNGKIFILSIFPATSLKKGSIGADGKLIISSDLRLQSLKQPPQQER